MSENAELWSRPDEESMRTILIDYFKRHSVTYEDSLTTEKLRQLYIDIECGSDKLFVEIQGQRRGLYCGKCGKWQKWITKEELQIAKFKGMKIIGG